MSVVAQRGADPAAVAYDAAAAAMARDIDVVIVDTAGRLQTSHDLMAELAKIRRVITRLLPEQPRHVLLVLDATTGQTASRRRKPSWPTPGDGDRARQARWHREGRGRGGHRRPYRIPIVFTCMVRTSRLGAVRSRRVP